MFTVTSHQTLQTSPTFLTSEKDRRLNNWYQISVKSHDLGSSKIAPLPCFLVLSIKHQTEVLFLDYKMFCPLAVFVRTLENILEFCQTTAPADPAAIDRQKWTIPVRFPSRRRMTSFLRYLGCICTGMFTCSRVSWWLF